MTHATLPIARLPWNRVVRDPAIALAAATLMIAYVLVGSAPAAEATEASVAGACDWTRDLPASWLPGIGAEPACR